MNMDNNTIIYDMPAPEYHAVEALSNSGIGRILQSESHYDHWWQHRKPPTANMIFGTVVHAAVLEPGTLPQLVAVSRKFDKRTKDGKAGAEAFAAENAGKIILDQDTYDQAMRCADAVLAHPKVQALLLGARVEVSLFWQDPAYDVPCKARMDILALIDGMPVIGDLKTTDDASPDAFGRSIASWWYHRQAAWYYAGHEAVLDKTPANFLFIAAEREPPHGVALYYLEPAHILAGAHRIDEALLRYRDARQNKRWPGYPEAIAPARIPAWALKFNE